MSQSKQVIEVGGEEWHRVRPIDHIESGGRSRDRPFGFTRAFPSDIPNTELDVPPNAGYEMVDGNVARYQYGNRVPIVVTANGPYSRPTVSKKDAEKQAYFAMSILDEHGLVSGWRRV